MKKINFNGVNIDVREFLDLIKQRVSKDMEHVSQAEGKQRYEACFYLN